MLISFSICAVPFIAYAGSVATDNVVAQLVSEQSAVEPGSSFNVALQLDIRDGWHTYWRNPGDSGQATAIKWALPEGVTAGEIQWPFPERQYVGPVANYGYHGTAMHLVEMQLDASWSVGEPIVLQANANWLVCEEECIPEKASLSLQIATAATTQTDPAQSEKFEQLRASLPIDLSVESGYQYLSDSDELRFEFSPAPELVSADELEYFPFDWGFISAPAEQDVLVDDAFVAISTRKGDLTFSKPMRGVIVTTGTNGQQGAFVVESSPGPLITESSAAGRANSWGTNAQTSMSIWMALVLALIGGVILNLMPCVFPVLSMKALNLVSHVGETAATHRKHGLIYTLGILVCFTALGVVLLGLKSAGQQIGWGFQLQSPIFVGLMALVLFVLGLSLSGLVELGTSLMGAGSSLAKGSGYKASFFTGVLAVVVATPCTAPFMGPAVGFALTQSAPVTISVLLALGLGLALPYLILSFVPAFTRWLPKPGLWMQRFQQFLAFPMYATAAWLVWVLGQQSGINGVFAILMLMILVALAIWLWQTTRSAGSTWRVAGRVVSALIVVITVSVFVIAMPSLQSTTDMSNSQFGSRGTDSIANQIGHQTFDVSELARLRSEGQPVFVNMTAAWCITCLANEKVALSSAELSDYFNQRGIVYMKGDWTNQNAVITDYLASFGRSSVPLYVYYPPVGEPQLLPQLLTVATVIDYIEKGDEIAKQSATVNTQL